MRFSLRVTDSLYVRGKGRVLSGTILNGSIPPVGCPIEVVTPPGFPNFRASYATIAGVEFRRGFRNETSPGDTVGLVIKDLDGVPTSPIGFIVNATFEDPEVKTSGHFEKYLVSYSYQMLMKYHQLSEYGIWEVKGEDANADVGGSHYQPVLGFFEGKLEDVIRHAVELPGFYAWGAGGSFKRITVQPVPQRA